VSAVPPWGVALIVPAAVLAALVGLAWRAPRIRVQIAGDWLVVEPLGLDKFWCVRRIVRVPRASVTYVRALRRRDVPLAGPRLPGSYLPGVITAGSYGLGVHRTFWDVRRADRLLVIDIRPGDATYYRLVLEVPDPDATAAALRQTLVA
jgi:hypothetical protein